MVFFFFLELIEYKTVFAEQKCRNTLKSGTGCIVNRVGNDENEKIQGQCNNSILKTLSVKTMTETFKQKKILHFQKRTNRISRRIVCRLQIIDFYRFYVQKLTEFTLYPNFPNCFTTIQVVADKLN